MSSSSHVRQPGPTGQASASASANLRPARARPIARSGGFTLAPNRFAAAAPATAPWSAAGSAPAIPVRSPAAYTPGTDVACTASTAANPPRSSQRAATASSTCGVNPNPTATASTSKRRSLCPSGIQFRSSRAVSTARTRSDPWAATTALCGENATPWATRKARSFDSPRDLRRPASAPAGCDTQPRTGSPASRTPTTRAPALTRDTAAGSRNGPVPATMTRSPTATPCSSAKDRAAPVVNTPGRSHPGNGRTRS